jgi:AGCS family alanine or glycine:cation symporter
MQALTDFTSSINGIVWGVPMLILILGTGLFLMLGLGFMPIRKLGTGFSLLWKGRESEDEEAGEISPFNALMTSLSATIGTGNIGGVALAIVIGGPGALFWMWMTALVGMATKFAEAVLAVKYREVDELGNHVGGPMYYIKNGLGPKYGRFATFLALAFSIFGAIAGFGIGNMTQSNAVASVMAGTFGISTATTGIVIAILVGLVILGGIKRIALVAGVLVPFMGIAYFLAGLVILAINITAIPAALALIVKAAFSPVAVGGGAAGVAVMVAIRQGVARGIFSNEAGLGSAPIAHAAARTSSPVRQGLIGMLGTFIDTIVVCSVTGLAIITSGILVNLAPGVEGADVTRQAFEAALPGFGGYIVACSLAIFAFTTILGWSVYGERCAVFLFGIKAIMPFRLAWVLAIPVGALAKLAYIWLLADTLNAMMAIPNLIALLLLSPVVFRLTKEYFKDAPKDSQKA